jgi:hypothetical protein
MELKVRTVVSIRNAAQRCCDDVVFKKAVILTDKGICSIIHADEAILSVNISIEVEIF